MENQKRLSFTIPSNPRRLTFRARPAAAAVDEETSPPSTPSPHFITEFDPSETLTPTAAAAAPVAITPIPNSHLFQRFIPSDPCERPSLPTTTTEEGIDFTAAESGDANPTSIASSSSFAYGLNKSKKAPPQATSSAELMRLRFKQDIAALPDHGDAEEDSMLSGKDFAAAFLKAYGWRKGEGIGRNNKEKGDTKGFCRGHRPGTQIRQMMSACNHDDWIVGKKNVTEIGARKKRMREIRDSIEVKDSSTRQKRPCKKRAAKEVHVKKYEPTTSNVLMDDGSELLLGLQHDMLETVLPRTNGRVLVLFGEHKGMHGHLVQKNEEEETGLVEASETKDIIRVSYNQVAEYVVGGGGGSVLRIDCSIFIS
ncbi:hypothetical protein HU200_015385 [Digitaria exilis]|uniref:G-patch domain-containing protein n=1 Tax=Digitaria exilis TaxID=1010633 RepID=A0A835FAV4_9POAL|nr:hypothetical protein HU200_015385 [Digitaria exilis]